MCIEFANAIASCGVAELIGAQHAERETESLQPGDKSFHPIKRILKTYNLPETSHTPPPNTRAVKWIEGTNTNHKI
ncbi:hypothetical protein ACLKA7_001500 [Drosophila subpalustris]